MQQLSPSECVVIALLIALVMATSIGTFKQALDAPPVQSAQRPTR